MSSRNYTFDEVLEKLNEMDLEKVPEGYDPGLWTKLITEMRRYPKFKDGMFWDFFSRDLSPLLVFGLHKNSLGAHGFLAHHTQHEVDIVKVGHSSFQVIYSEDFFWPDPNQEELFFLGS